MRMPRARPLLLLALLALPACKDNSSPNGPGGTTARVEFVYMASTVPRTDLPLSAQACVQGVGRTHIHPSWRDFTRIDLQAVGSSRWQIILDDVPIDQRLSIRISDGNVCDENSTGAATRNVFANNTRLTEIVPTPGSGTEPGLALTVSRSGVVTP